MVQDNVIYERLGTGGNLAVHKVTEKHLEHFAVDGLRTLCVAEREIEQDLYEVRNWSLSDEDKYVCVCVRMCVCMCVRRVGMPSTTGPAPL